MTRLLVAEWTKLRTVPRWMLGLLVALVLIVGVSWLGASGSSTSGAEQDLVRGPDGTPVLDEFRFVHRTLTGDGSITAQVVSLAGDQREVSDWAKAGVIVKDGVRPGASYLALMRTIGHGVRLQHDFTEDAAGSENARWLRLTRSGTTLTGAESSDGRDWHDVDTADLAGLPETVEVGLFVASPAVVRLDRGLTSSSMGGSPSSSTATFADVSVLGRTSGVWQSTEVGQPGNEGTTTAAGSGFTVTGSGDIAPNPPGANLVRMALTGAFVGLIAVVAVAALFVTAEYKRGMVRTTFTASPARARVLVAKAAVIGAAAFGLGLVASVLSYLLAMPVLRANGFSGAPFPSYTLTDPVVLRALAGTAVLLAAIAVLALAAGSILRHSAAAITTVILLVVVPTLIVAALPVSAGRWLLRLTPAAGFSIQRTDPQFDQIDIPCLPEDGCTFASPWPGLGVSVAYAAVALAVACWLVRRRDA